MVKRTVVAAATILVAMLVGTAIVGPVTVWNLVTTGRRHVDQAVSEYVAPEVALQSALRRAEKELPQRIAELRSTQSSTARQLAVQTRLVGEDRQALALVEDDLRVLAQAVLDERTELEVRGGKFGTAQEIRSEAGRLMRKRDQLAEQLEVRESVVQGLVKTRAQLAQQLQTARDAVAGYQADVSRVEGRIELLKAGQRLESLRTALHADGLVSEAVSSELSQLDRRLQAKLLEQEERECLRGGLSKDSHREAVRAGQLVEECRKFVQSAGGDKEPQE